MTLEKPQRGDCMRQWEREWNIRGLLMWVVRQALYV